MSCMQDLKGKLNCMIREKISTASIIVYSYTFNQYHASRYYLILCFLDVVLTYFYSEVDVLAAVLKLPRHSNYD